MWNFLEKIAVRDFAPKFSPATRCRLVADVGADFFPIFLADLLLLETKEFNLISLQNGHLIPIL
jgi:hypothetical protein